MLKLVVYAPPRKRGSWDLNGEVGWRAGPPLNQHRCVKCCMSRAKTVVDSDTLNFSTLHALPYVKEYM